MTGTIPDDDLDLEDRKQRDVIRRDMEDFEKVLWPVYQEFGINKQTAVIHQQLKLFREDFRQLRQEIMNWREIRGENDSGSGD